MDNIADTKRNITSADAGTKVIVSAVRGAIMAITINKTSAQALTLYDDKTTSPAAGRIFATLKASIVENTYFYGSLGLQCDYGLVVDVPGSYTGDATVAFKKI